MKQLSSAQTEYLLGRPIAPPDTTAINERVLGRVVMVTGAAGSIGSELVQQLLRYKPRQIILLDQAESALYELLILLATDLERDVLLTGQIADITDAVRMRHLFDRYRPDCIFHTAAYKHVPLMEEHPYEAVKTNVLGTKIVADLAVACSAQTFVLISTDKAVNPTSVMGVTKQLAERYVLTLNATASTRFVVTRFGNVLDSAGSVVPLFKRQIEAGGPVTVTHPDVCRYFMTLSEACLLVLESVALGDGGEVFIFDMGQPVRIVDLACRLIQRAGYEIHKDIQVRFTGLRRGEKLHEELLNVDECGRPTRHPNISVARPQVSNAYPLQQVMDRLRVALRNADDSELVSLLQKYIPAYSRCPSSSADRKEGAIKTAAT